MTTPPPNDDDTPERVWTDREALLVLLERVEWLENLHVRADEIYRGFPTDVIEHLEADRAPSMLNTDLALALASVTPEKRQQLHGQIRDVRALLKRSLGGKTGDKLVGNLSTSIAAGIIRVMEQHGTKSIREVERFVEAFDAHDVAYLVIKTADGKAEASFTRHLPKEAYDTLGLKIM